MEYLQSGQFYGQTNETLCLDGIILTDTEYTHEKVDWHFHENAYFTFVLEGQVLEGNKKNIFNCSEGSLLFHYWQESHYNIKPEGFTRGFQIELIPDWFNLLETSCDALHGSLNLFDPRMKAIMYRIFKETKIGGSNEKLAINTLLVELFSNMMRLKETTDRIKPAWVEKIKEILNESSAEWDLKVLAGDLNIHPVHLSRNFHKYFHCSLGDYIRTLKIQHALSMFPKTELSLTEIALISGFADQSHFIKSFKAIYNISPLKYRKIIYKRA